MMSVNLVLQPWAQSPLGHPHFLERIPRDPADYRRLRSLHVRSPGTAGAHGGAPRQSDLAGKRGNRTEESA